LVFPLFSRENQEKNQPSYVSKS